MTFFAVFLAFVIWLALGGWALYVLMLPGSSTRTLGHQFVICLLLAPFAFGFAVAAKQADKKPNP